jgi:hypothetical protein
LIRVQLVGAGLIRAADSCGHCENPTFFRSERTFGVVGTVLTTKEFRRRQLNNAIKSWPASANNCCRAIDSRH